MQGCKLALLLQQPPLSRSERLLSLLCCLLRLGTAARCFRQLRRARLLAGAGGGGRGGLGRCQPCCQLLLLRCLCLLRGLRCLELTPQRSRTAGQSASFPWPSILTTSRLLAAAKCVLYVIRSRILAKEMLEGCYTPGLCVYLLGCGRLRLYLMLSGILLGICQGLSICCPLSLQLIYSALQILIVCHL